MPYAGQPIRDHTALVAAQAATKSTAGCDQNKRSPNFAHGATGSRGRCGTHQKYSDKITEPGEKSSALIRSPRHHVRSDRERGSPPIAYQ
jgi:hypothetical protein